MAPGIRTAPPDQCDNARQSEIWLIFQIDAMRLLLSWHEHLLNL